MEEANVLKEKQDQASQPPNIEKNEQEELALVL